MSGEVTLWSPAFLFCKRSKTFLSLQAFISGRLICSSSPGFLCFRKKGLSLDNDLTVYKSCSPRPPTPHRPLFFFFFLTFPSKVRLWSLVSLFPQLLPECHVRERRNPFVFLCESVLWASDCHFLFFSPILKIQMNPFLQSSLEAGTLEVWAV